MDKYQITDNGILITTTSSGKNLYKTSKLVIKDNSKLIDENIRSIHICEKIKLEIAPIEIIKKEEIIDFQNKQIAFYELYCFFLNFSIDFSISCRELFLAKSKSEQIFYIKSIYIELYRYLERHNNDLGIIKTLCNDLEKFKEYTTLLNKFRLIHYEDIKTNRNLFFAHFDKNNQYDNYFKFVSKLNAEQVAKICNQFLAVQEKSMIILKEISEIQKDTTYIIADILKKKKEETDKAVQEKIKELIRLKIKARTANRVGSR